MCWRKSDHYLLMRTKRLSWILGGRPSSHAESTVEEKKYEWGLSRHHYAEHHLQRTAAPDRTGC